MFIKKTVSITNQIDITTAKRCAALLDESKALPYVEVIEKLIKETDIPKGKSGEAARSSLRLFAKYLEDNKVIYPTAVDAIDFVYQNVDEVDNFGLHILFTNATWIVNYCSQNFHKLFGGIFAGKTITRKISLKGNSIINEDSISFEYRTFEEN